MIRSQLAVLARLETETRSELRALEDRHLHLLASLWAKVERDLKARILHAHRAAHPDGKWDIGEAHFKRTLHAFDAAISETMGAFKKDSYALVDAAMAEIRRLEIRRAAWMLAQVTPGNIIIKAPKGSTLRREAETPEEPAFQWMSTWLQTNDAWSAALSNNLRMAAVAGTEPEGLDAIVGGTRAGYPAFRLFDSLKRIYVTAAISEQAQAQVDVAEANEEVVDTEVWQTLEDATVCPLCEDYFGRERDELEAEGVYIPAHMNDRCFWRVVPKAWAELLQSGDEFDREMALAMDDQGLVEDSLAIYGADGKTLVGSAVVQFEDWDQDVAEREYAAWKSDWERRNPSKGQLLSQGGR